MIYYSRKQTHLYSNKIYHPKFKTFYLLQTSVIKLKYKISQKP